MSKNKGEMKEKAKKAPKRMRSVIDKIKTLHRKGDPARAKIFVKTVPAKPIPDKVKRAASMNDFKMEFGQWHGPNGVTVSQSDYDAIYRDRCVMLGAIAG